MTGEMHSISQKGLDSNGDTWPIHAAIARAVGGRLEPFDVYQGPYIVVGPDIRVGRKPYQVAVQHLGVLRLWLFADDDGTGTVYREDTDTKATFFPIGNTRRACKAARSLLKTGEAK